MYLAFNASGMDDISLRLNPSLYDEHTQTLYVNVELRYSGHGQLYLADQNYRLYYDSELLSLKENESRSDLPQDLYSNLQFMEIFEGLEANNVNQLAFDAHLGFINFNIDLHNAAYGGLAIREEDKWQRVAVLNFKVSDEEQLSEIVWSQTGVTDEYATAFVEIMEWKGPNDTAPVKVNKLIDASFNKETASGDVSLTLAPNPTTDFVKLSFEEAIKQDYEVAVYDVTGRKVKRTVAFKGAASINMAVADLSAGNYLVELIDADTQESSFRTSFIKIDK